MFLQCQDPDSVEEIIYREDGLMKSHSTARIGELTNGVCKYGAGCDSLPVVIQQGLIEKGHDFLSIFVTACLPAPDMAGLRDFPQGDSFASG